MKKLLLLVLILTCSACDRTAELDDKDELIQESLTKLRVAVAANVKPTFNHGNDHGSFVAPG